MQPVKKLLGQLGRQFSIPMFIAKTGKQLILPFYHTISNDYLPHIAHLYRYNNEKEFERDLDLLLKHFDPITLQELIEADGNGAFFSKPTMHLSFDDGLRECAEIIAPILKRKGIPATFFVNSGFVDNRGLMFRYKVSLIMDKIEKSEISHGELDAIKALMPTEARKPKNTSAIKKLLGKLGYEHQFVINQIADVFEIDFGVFLRNQKPYMTKSQIRNLVEAGFTVGAHSIDHPMYSKLDIVEQLEQTTESLHYVQEVFQVPYKVFAFPFTDSGVSARFFDELYNQGEPLVDLSFGTAGLKTDVHSQHLQRIPMDNTNLDADQIIKTAYTASLVQQTLGINDVKRR
jgi:peptidoglycan/xylan/chitin deacetylase (PgdA/CDA1 family)